MSPLGGFFLTLVCVYVTAAGDHVDQLESHYAHIRYVSKYKCLHPQPRVIPVSKLLPDEKTHNKAYFPDVTVLHRCDAAVGACPSRECCAPVSSQPVTLTFKITFLDGVEGHKPGSWVLEDHSMDNHTECACTADLDLYLEPWTGTVNYGKPPIPTPTTSQNLEQTGKK